MKDLVRESIQAGRVVIWEEVARDGAQAETLLNAEQRIEIAQSMSAIFGENAPNQLLFAVGYPSMGSSEFEIIRKIVDQVDTCSLATHGRATRNDIDRGFEAMKGAKFGRVSYSLPSSDLHSDIMMHLSKEEVIQKAVDLACYAMDKSNGVPVDVAFGVASRVDPGFLADSAAALCEEGISTVKICDSTGELFPREVHKLFSEIMKRIPDGTIIGSHLHNDFGLALASTLETIQLGVRLVATSWLGLGERAGLPPTEELLLALGHNLDTQFERLGIRDPLWYQSPDLTKVIPTAQKASQFLDIPLRHTDPVVGTHMNHIATGAYFNNPKAFKPFDPESLLGVPPKLMLTHLTNHKIIETISTKMGYTLDEDKIKKTLVWVKTWAYENQQSVVPTEDFENYLKTL